MPVFCGSASLNKEIGFIFLAVSSFLYHSTTFWDRVLGDIPSMPGIAFLSWSEAKSVVEDFPPPEDDKDTYERRTSRRSLIRTKPSASTLSDLKA
jgi:hypothetical protein